MAGKGSITLAPDAEAQAPGHLEVLVDPVNALHLAQTGCAQQAIALPVQGAELPAGEFRKVIDVGRKSCGRGDASGLIGRDHIPGAVTFERCMADRQLLTAQVLRHVGRCIVHAQWIQQSLAHVIRKRLARNGFDDLAHQGQAQIGILPVAGGRVQSLLLPEALADFFLGRERIIRISPVREIGLARQAGGMGQQSADRDRFVIGMSVVDIEPVQVFGHRVIETQLPGLALLHQADAGKQL